MKKSLNIKTITLNEAIKKDFSYFSGIEPQREPTIHDKLFKVSKEN